MGGLFFLILLKGGHIKLSNIIYVSGGARSGKSSFGEGRLEEVDGNKSYIATSIPFDEGMVDRIKKHVARRPSQWKTYEIQIDIDRYIDVVLDNSDGIILDCVTVLITNMMFKNPDIDWDSATREEIDIFESNIIDMFSKMIEKIEQHDVQFIIISNELGMGIVPEGRLSRIFRDVAGKVNQFIAEKSDEAYFCVSGIAMKLK